MKKLFVLLFTICTTTLFAQGEATDFISEVKKFQQELNKEYKGSTTSPLESKEIKLFKGHSFFPANSKYRVTAMFTPVSNPPVYNMQTTSGQVSPFVKFGEVSFTIDGKEYKLAVYQSIALRQRKGYEDYLFLPFTDATNGKQTYHGGRYIDLRIPKTNSMVIDFNKAYNPYCAYNGKYSCPVVPAENHLNIEIPAGIMLEHE
jgi:uncharacterized protein (DUF1684 family)